ncbi:MAG: hypothetical protein NZ959_10660 [Armatimonadetes bacterium]|nr:hypothetical protein [Armatimonadota bacterium]MDW8121131.1 hypothetical protein [Armatimonadota bacterium]
MTERSLILLIGLLLVTSSLSTAQLSNGGFEDIGPDRFPVGWTGFSSDPSLSMIRVTTDAVEGRFALHMEALKDNTVGLNRVYKATPGIPAKEIGALLPIKKGVLIFRYKLLKATADNVRMYVIPMKADNVEGGGVRATYVLPAAFAGDNKWHRGVLAFDFQDRPEVARIQIGPRINEGGRHGPGAVIFDDIQVVPQWGWHLRLAGLRWKEGEKAGYEGIVSLLFENTGDQPAPVSANFTPPAPLKAILEESPQAIGPGTVGQVSWRVFGQRKVGSRASFQWQADQEEKETISHTFRARLNLISLSFASALLFRGVTYPLRLTLSNEGDAVLEGLPVRLTLSEGVRLVSGPVAQTIPLVPPGRLVLEWKVEARKSGQAQVKADIGAGPAAFPMGCRAVISDPINPKSKATLSVSTKKVRLFFPKNSFGYGVIAAEVFTGGKWKPMALSPQLLLVRYQDVRRRDITRPVYASAAEPLGDGGIAFPFQWQDIDDGTIWSGRLSFRPDGDSIVVSWQLHLNKKKPVLGIQGPVFFVGDNGFGSKKEAGLLPGVYWLLKDETTQDTRFSDPPHHLHIVPHPYKLTQPMMVLAEGGAYFGLLWDPLQNWTEGDGRGADTGLCPQPLFVSPNHLAEQDNHLMGLMVPNVPAWLDENNPWAVRPISNLSYQLTARIFGGAGGILDAYNDYFEQFPLPSVPPYNPKEIFQRSKAAERPPRYGRLTGFIGTVRAQAQEDVKTQREDGSWAYTMDQNFTRPNLAKFAPHRPLDDYGKEGDTTLGTCTFVNRRATALLRYARLTGSEWARTAGLKALDYIDRAFIRPEGAQTWEVPLHCPDVLAAANAITTYLEGWMLTGRDQFLERAIYWAKTGLPFIYFWNAPDRPKMMAFASIPVFGTSFFSAAAWFGTPVQWNGLDYAYSLMKLAKALETSGPPKDRYHDPAFWRHIAEGITVAGAQMQEAVDHPQGYYPDSVALTFAYRPNDPGILHPHGIVRTLWFLANPRLDPEDYDSKVMGWDGLTVHITTEGLLHRVHRSDDALSLVISCPVVEEEFQTIVTPIRKPTRVVVNGQELEPFTGQPTGRWWRYRSDRALLEIRLRGPMDEAEIVIFDVVPTAPLPERVWVQPVWEFNTKDDPEDWTIANHLSDPVVSDGLLQLASTGPDPYFHSPALQVDTSKVRTLVLRARFRFPAGATPIGQVFWTRQDDPNWSESKSLHFPLPTDGNWHTLRVNLSASPEWKGTITQIRLDPGSGTGIEVEIDFIRLE